MKTFQQLSIWCFLGLVSFVPAPSDAQHKDNLVLQQATAAEENEWNSVSQAYDGKQYKLVLIGDCLPKLTVNGKVVPKAELNMYEEVVDRLTDIILEKQRKEWERRNKILAGIKQAILRDLLTSGQFASQDSIHSYYLTATEFLVNEQIQKPSVLMAFREKYLKSADRAIYYETTERKSSFKR